MVRDLIVDMGEKDLVFRDRVGESVSYFDVVWGNIFDSDEGLGVLFCNIVVPEIYRGEVEFGDKEEIAVRFAAPYRADVRNFRIRLIGIRDGGYSLIGDDQQAEPAGTQLLSGRHFTGWTAYSYALSKLIAAPIAASMLPFVDIDGEYLVRIVKDGKAYVYSGKESDVNIGYSDDQAAQLLSINAPGKYYRYPTLGVGITGYLNSVVDHSDLSEVLERQFAADSKTIQDASFDNETCDLSVLFSPEEGRGDEYLLPIDALDKAFFAMFTDDAVRKNMIIQEVDDLDYVRLLNEYVNFVGILFFPNPAPDSETVRHSTMLRRIDAVVEEGAFDIDGEVVANEEYYVVSGTLEAKSIVMFDIDQPQSGWGQDAEEMPLFVVNGNDETQLYKSFIGQDYWNSLTETAGTEAYKYHKCFVLMEKAKVRYAIRREDYRNGKGLFVIPQTSENVKNMLSLVQDVHTGRIMSVVSTKTNISDVVIDEITQGIYAKINN